MSDSRSTSLRPIQSCYQCRKRKIKCSRSYPCAPCVLRGEGNSCREVDRSIIQTLTRATEIEDLLQRVKVLEGTVLRLSRLLPGSPPAPTAPAEGQPRISDSSVLPHSAGLKSSIRSLFGTSASDEDVAMMLEDFAMGHRVNRSRATQDAETTESLAQETSVHVTAGLPKPHPLALLVDTNANVIRRLLRTFPGESESRSLVDFYFERLEWYSKVLHRPTFLEERDTLLRQISDDNVHLIRTSFLGVYCMVLCLSIHLIEPAVCSRLGLDFLTTSDVSQTLYSAAQACVQFDDFLGSHSLEHLQCIILMGVYKQNLDEADSHWALLGSAIKIAQNLGISRLGSEADGQQYPATWRSPIKREIARRVWWSLIFDDWSHAAAHHGTYSVHPSQNHTGYPANIDDADLTENQPVQSKPSHQYTEMTFSLCRLRFVELYRQIIDNMQSPTGHAFVVEMDLKISQVIAQLPLYFQVSSPAAQVVPRSVKGLEMTLCLIMGETRRLRLHRPFLFRGYKEKQFARSREQCVNSAKAILQHLRSNDGQSAILLKWWIVLFYGFAAAVVLFIDLCHHKADDSPDLDQRRADLHETLQLFKSAEHISNVSRNAIALLEGLLAAEPEIASVPSRKRSVPDDDNPFQHIVKRMIVDASKGLTVPTSQLYTQASPQWQGPQSDTSFPSFFTTHPGSDIFASGILFRDEGIFAGVQFDDTTMAELQQLISNTSSHEILPVPVGFQT